MFAVTEPNSDVSVDLYSLSGQNGRQSGAESMAAS